MAEPAKPKKNPANNRRVAPAGEPVDWAPSEIDRRSQTTDGDKLNAVTYWRANAPRDYRELLNAAPRRRRGER